MKYKIVGAQGTQSKELKKKLDQIGTFSDENFQYLFVIGGDGSLINYLKKYAFSEKRIIGIKGGTLSFLTDKIPDIFLKEELFTRIELLKLEWGARKYYAFNDIFISGASFLKSDLFISEEFFINFRGSGLLFSTKIGSTSQNKSFLGPVIFPSVEGWILNFIGAQSTNKFPFFSAPMVLSNQEEVKLDISDSYLIYIDGKPIQVDGKALEIGGKPEKIDEKSLRTDQKEKSILKIKLVECTSYFYFPKNTKEYLKKLSSTFIYE